MRYKDFDAFFAEKAGKPVTFNFAGKEYRLSTELPASVGLECARMQSNLGSESNVPPDALEKMGKAVLGADNFDEIIAAGASMNQLGDILKWVMEEYQNGDHPAEDSSPGNAPAPDEPGESIS